MDSDEGELLSGWEEDSSTEKRYLISLPHVLVDPASTILLFSAVNTTKETVDDIAFDNDVIYMEDLATR